MAHWVIPRPKYIEEIECLSGIQVTRLQIWGFHISLGLSSVHLISSVWVSASLQRCKFLFLRLVSPEAHAMSLIIHLLQEDKGLINSNKGKRKFKK